MPFMRRRRSKLPATRSEIATCKLQVGGCRDLPAPRYAATGMNCAAQIDLLAANETEAQLRPWCASNNSNMREACTKGSLSAPLRVMAETVFFVIAASPTRAPLARARGLRREGCLVVKQPPEVHCCWIERRAVAGLAVITRRLRGCNPHAHAKISSIMPGSPQGNFSKRRRAYQRR